MSHTKSCLLLQAPTLGTDHEYWLLINVNIIKYGWLISEATDLTNNQNTIIRDSVDWVKKQDYTQGKKISFKLTEDTFGETRDKVYLGLRTYLNQPYRC